MRRLSDPLRPPRPRPWTVRIVTVGLSSLLGLLAAGCGGDGGAGLDAAAEPQDAATDALEGGQADTSTDASTEDSSGADTYASATDTGGALPDAGSSDLGASDSLVDAKPDACADWYACQTCGVKACAAATSTCTKEASCKAALNAWAACVLACGDVTACRSTFVSSGGKSASLLVACLDDKCPTPCWK